MRREQIDEILGVFDSVFQQLGAPGGYDGAVEAIEAAMVERGNGGAAVVEIGMIVAKQLFRNLGGTGLPDDLDPDQLPTRKELEKRLMKCHDLMDEDLVALDQLKRAPIQVRQAFKVVARSIKPKGGHPVLVARSERSKVCDRIAASVRTGRTLGLAKKQAAVHYGCSVSTINMIWRSRE